jgi:sn-glycerol 3-phosphate transport system substrate-binding protein
MKTMKHMAASALGIAALTLANPAIAQEQVELTMYYPIAVGGPLTEVIDGIVEDFEAENPNVSVEAIYAGNYDDTRVRALSAIEAGDSPDLSVMFSIDLYELLSRDIIVPFDVLARTKADKEWLNSFYPALMENGQTDGNIYGIPFQRSTIVMYWNKEAFAEAGLDPEQAPADWSEMTTMGAQIRESSGNNQWGVMIPSTGYPYWMFQALAFQNGHRLMSADGTEVYFDDPAAIEALEYWVDLSQADGAMPDGTIEWGTLRQNFLEEETAMMWHSTGNLTAVKNNADFDFGVAMLPTQEQRGSPTGGGNFHIFKDTTKAERKAAFDLVRFMTAPERAARWSIETGYMGVSPAAYETEALEAYVEDFPPAAVARDQLEHATAELSTYDGGQIREALNNAIQAALTDEQSPAEALADAQRQADRILRRY